MVDIGGKEVTERKATARAFVANRYRYDPWGNILDEAESGDTIFVCGYGSGAGSDAFQMQVTKAIESYDRSGPQLLETQLAQTVNLDYATYAKHRGKLIMGGTD